jgi:hypothetical protein
METLLVVAIVLTSLAVLTQAGVLIAMYLMARRVSDNVNGLVSESQKLMEPLERVTANFKTASESLVDVGKDARIEMTRVQSLLTETHAAIRDEIQDLRYRVNSTIDEVQDRVMAPIRTWSALASGINAGVRTFFAKRQPPAVVEEEIIIFEGDKPQAPAA